MTHSTEIKMPAITKWFATSLAYLFPNEPNFYWAPDSQGKQISHICQFQKAELKNGNGDVCCWPRQTKALESSL